LSVTLQKGVSLSVDGVHVAPDMTAHMRLRLLVRPQHAVAVPVVVDPAVVPNIPVGAYNPRVAVAIAVAVET
jgi:hypothetical protein